MRHDLFRKTGSPLRDHALTSSIRLPYPQLAVSAAIFRDGKILLVRRARSPARGFYSLPGGRVEFGEPLHAALHREIGEETALKIEIIDLAAWREVLPGTSGGGHYLIMSFAARWSCGEVVLNDELDDYQWLAPDALGELKITGGLPEVIRSARRLVDS
jgi:8-oxo-dGTP diphosphatase